MLCEATVVLASSDNHFGVSRALRPLFLLDIVMLQDVRRYVHTLVYVKLHTYIYNHTPIAFNLCIPTYVTGPEKTSHNYIRVKFDHR